MFKHIHMYIRASEHLSHPHTHTHTCVSGWMGGWVVGCAYLNVQIRKTRYLEGFIYS